MAARPFAAAAAALLFVEAVAGPFEAVEALALPFAEPEDSGVVAQLVAFEALVQASARRPAGAALEMRQRVWIAAVAEPGLAFVRFLEQPALLEGPEQNRQLSADPREVLANSFFPGFSDYLLLRGDLGKPQRGASPPAGFEG